MINTQGKTVGGSLFCTPSDSVDAGWVVRAADTWAKRQRETHRTGRLRPETPGPAHQLRRSVRVEVPVVTDLLMGHGGVCPAPAVKGSCHKTRPLDLTTVS